MTRGDDVTLKSRRISYDDFTSSFIVEKKVETVERLCRQRTMHAETLNRGEDKFKEANIRRAGKGHQIYNMRYFRERESSRANLQDMLSHKVVLNSVAKLNDADPAWNLNLGRYGPGASKFELATSIEDQKKKMGPVYRRRQEAENHLRQRRPMPVMDQTMSTESFLARWRAPRWRSTEGAPSSRAQRTRRLPPISASRSLQITPGKGAGHPRGLDSPSPQPTASPSPSAPAPVKREESTRVREVRARRDTNKDREEEEKDTVAPLASRGPSNVFITQKSFQTS